MKRETTAEGPTVAEALDSALEELGVQQDAVEYDVIEEGGRRLFGIGNEKVAKVHVRLKQSFVAELEAEKNNEPEEPDEDVAAAKIADEPPPAEVRRPPVFELPELTDEELDRVADEAVSSVQSVLQGFGITASIEEYEGDEGEIILDVVGDDLGVLIGRHGRTLDALQTLVSAVTNRRIGFRYPVLLDIEGYRNRRREKLEEIATRACERAIRSNDVVKLRPMSSYERKVVHVFLREDARVSTASEGDEPFRQVVISPS